MRSFFSSSPVARFLPWLALPAAPSLVGAQADCKTRGAHLYTINQKEAGERGLTRLYKVKSFHVSCRSDRPALWEGDKHLGGIILYSYNGKTDWYCGGVHCKSGYIVVREVEEIRSVCSEKGKSDGKVYRSLFGEDYDPSKVVGEGFSFDPKRDPKWKFNSGSFNAPGGSKYHDRDKGMGERSERALKETLNHWITTGKQTHDVSKYNLTLQPKKEADTSRGCVIL